MKKIAHFFLIFLSVSIFFQGCSKKTADYNDTVFVMGTIGNDYTYSNNGIIHISQGIAYFFDPEYGIAVPICTKLNCDHQGRTLSNLSPVCNAYLAEWVNCAAITGDKLYYVSCPDDEGLFVKEFIKANKDGTGRNVMYRVEDVEFFSCGIYEDGYMVYSYYNSDNFNGEKLEKNQIGMLVLDLETEKMTRITLEDRYKGQILHAIVCDGHLYCLLSYFTDDIQKYGYEDLVSGTGSEFFKSLQRVEIWEFDIESATGRQYDVPPADYSSYMLGYGYILHGYDGNGKFEVVEISTGNTYCLNNMYSGANITMMDEGVLFVKDGIVWLWRYGLDQLERIGEYNSEYAIGLYWVTDKWVYGWRTIEAGSTEIMEVTDCCWPRKDFMKGKYEWIDIKIPE